jgi:hypothetical protein
LFGVSILFVFQYGVDSEFQAMLFGFSNCPQKFELALQIAFTYLIGDSFNFEGLFDYSKIAGFV